MYPLANSTAFLPSTGEKAYIPVDSFSSFIALFAYQNVTLLSKYAISTASKYIIRNLILTSDICPVHKKT